MEDKRSHFKGKNVVEHLKEARKKGNLATRESHGLEPMGHLMGGSDSAKEVSMVSFVVWIVSNGLSLQSDHTFLLLGLLMFAFLIWKTGRAAILGWSRLERVNKLVEDERNEILHNREEEKKELTEMYRAKGFSPPLLEKVIDVLMADDNKLLGVMLEEELGVSLEIYEHPLKEALGAGIGVLIASVSMTIGLIISPHVFPFFVLGNVIIASYVMAKIERIQALHNIVWNAALLFLVSGMVYFLTLFLIKEWI